MPYHSPTSVDTTTDARRQLTLQVTVLTRLRLAAAAYGEYRTLRQVSRKLAQVRAALDALQQKA